MAWGQEKGADFHISAPRACQYEIFDFVPCSLPLKTLILLTFSCFLIRRRGRCVSYFSARRFFCTEPTVCGRLFAPDLTVGEHIEMDEHTFFYMGETQERCVFC